MPNNAKRYSATQLLRELEHWKEQTFGTARNVRVWEALGSETPAPPPEPPPEPLREILGDKPTLEMAEQLERDLRKAATAQIVSESVEQAVAAIPVASPSSERPKLTKRRAERYNSPYRRAMYQGRINRGWNADSQTIATWISENCAESQSDILPRFFQRRAKVTGFPLDIGYLVKNDRQSAERFQGDLSKIKP